MRPGSPNFDSRRFVEARQARGLTATTVAELLGVTRSAVSKWQTGQASPSPELLHRISLVLNVPIGYFVDPERDQRFSKVYYRSEASSTKSMRDQGKVRLKWISRLHTALREHFEFPTPDLPPAIKASAPTDINSETIEQLATDTRRYWGLGDGPITNIVGLLESKGFVISRCVFESTKFDSFSSIDENDDTPYLIINSEKESGPREQFDCAHELAHMLLHSAIPDEAWNVSEYVRVREIQAHKYAGAFLLPEKSFVRDIPEITLEALLAIKPRWRVSIAAMISRVAELQLVSDDRIVGFWKSINRRGWRRREPLDLEIGVNKPRLIHLAMNMLTEDDPFLARELVGSVNLAESDVMELAGLPPDYFEKDFDARGIVRLKPATG
jgi:Zn-dependent peptidase ImmA (M78 family)/DNA-binding XRE family transcriptional regulator